jgi:nitrite reductase (NADH) small subunit
MTAAVEEKTLMDNWVSVCLEDDLVPGTGVCAKVNGAQVALFKLRANGDIFAVDNYDPIGKANVLSRGITGSLGESLVVASPLYKQHFDLQTGRCLEDDDVSIKTYSVKVEDGAIWVKP